jgi:hypothetical protein
VVVGASALENAAARGARAVLEDYKLVGGLLVMVFATFGWIALRRSARCEVLIAKARSGIERK